jgi:hypothetical protein
VAQIPSDVLGLLNQRDEPHLAPAPRAGLDVEVEAPAHEHMPRDVAAAMGRRAAIFAGTADGSLAVHAEAAATAIATG